MSPPSLALLRRAPLFGVLAAVASSLGCTRARPVGAPGSPSAASAESTAAQMGAPPAVSAAGTGASVAVLDVVFVRELANAIQATDSLVAPAATVKLRQHFAAAPGVTVIDSARLAGALHSPAVVAAAGGKACAVVLACMAAVREATGAEWVAAGRLTKISSLVWVFTGQLMEPATGRLTINDDYEVKGAAADMAEVGARIFARRAVAKMRQTGVAASDDRR